MRRSHHPNSVSAGRWGTRFAALLAVFLQVFVVQTHVHARTLPSVAAGYERTVHAAAVSHIEAAHHAQIACALCQAQATGRALAPGTAAIESVEARPPLGPSTEIRLVAVAPSHSWQSRAPPAHS